MPTIRPARDLRWIFDNVGKTVAILTITYTSTAFPAPACPHRDSAQPALLCRQLCAMRPSGGSSQSIHSNGPSDVCPRHVRTPSSSYVSTLSNALNIVTPKSLKKSSTADTPRSVGPFSTPDTAAHDSTRFSQGSAISGDALRTPTRSTRKREPPPILSLSGHEAFQSPLTPSSPWSDAPGSAVVQGAGSARHGQSTHIPNVLENKAQDYAWLMSGPASTSGAANIFGTPPSRISASCGRSDGDPFHTSTEEQLGSNVMSICARTTTIEPVGRTSDHFTTYREQPGSELCGQHPWGLSVGADSAGPSTLSPASASSLSPVLFATALSSITNGGVFEPATKEQETPSMSTHLLPSNDLTECLPRRSEPNTALTSPQCHFESTHVTADTNLPGGVALLRSTGDGFAPGASDPSAFGRPVHAVAPDLDTPLSFDASAGLHTTSLGTSGSHLSGSKPDARHIAGLGLELHPGNGPEQAELFMSPTQPTSRPSMMVDEMGRWILQSPSQPSELSLVAGASERERRLVQGTSTSSLSTAAETCFMSHSNASTLDSSFGEAPSPSNCDALAVADMNFVNTPASSVGHTSRPNLHLGKLSDQTRSSSESQSAREIPEIFMSDLSEFGQSVPIEQMAEERWRTWAGNRGLTNSKDVFSAAASQPCGRSAISHLTTAAEPRTSFDSLSVPASCARSRLMTEPYNKSMRSSRPSSSSSTSSRSSSINNAAALEGQPFSGVTGPTRPRSYMAIGTLRMSSVTRSNSSGGREAISSPNERSIGSALAFRRARGLSQTVQASVGSNSPTSTGMKSTRSADYITPLATSSSAAVDFGRSVALQTQASSDGLDLMTQRPQTMLETSSSPSSSRVGAESKPKGRVGFNEVAVALNTLRMFLKQKDTSTSSNAPTHHVGHALSLTEASCERFSPPKPIRTLRRAKGVLPQRGAFSAVDQLDVPEPNAGSQGLDRLDQSQSRSRSISSPDHTSPYRPPDDKLAVLDDLSERVMRLKAESELEQQRHAAASMPPPAVPLGMGMPQMQQQMQTSPRTRREMHDEYLRKRASGC